MKDKSGSQSGWIRWKLLFAIGVLAVPLLWLGSSSELDAQRRKRARKASSWKSFARRPKYLFLISIDGLAYKHLADPSVSMPTLRKLAKMGVWGRSVAAFPSMTWPSHASILTGQTPRYHGVLGNQWMEEFKRFVKPYTANMRKRRQVPSLIELARRKYRIASIAWPGTQGIRGIRYHLPEVYTKYNVRYYMSRRNPIRRMLKQIGFDIFYLPRIMYSSNIDKDDLMDDLARKLIALPKYKRPQLYLLHYLALDHWLHEYGGDKKNMHRIVQRIAPRMDQYVAKVIRYTKRAGIYRQSAFFIVSDHGFAECTKTIDVRQVLIKAGLSRYHGLTTWKLRRERVVGLRNGHTAFIYIRGKNARHQRRLTRRARKALEAIPEVQKVYSPREYHSLGFPKPSEHKGSPQLIALAKVNVYFRSNPRGVLVRSGVKWGMHGYLPTHPDMQVPFVAAGAGIRHLRRRLRLRNIDIAPTIARLLRLRWPRGQEPSGRTLRRILRR